MTARHSLRRRFTETLREVWRDAIEAFRNESRAVQLLVGGLYFVVIVLIAVKIGFFVTGAELHVISDTGSMDPTMTFPAVLVCDTDVDPTTDIKDGDIIVYRFDGSTQRHIYSVSDNEIKGTPPSSNLQVHRVAGTSRTDSPPVVPRHASVRVPEFDQQEYDLRIELDNKSMNQQHFIWYGDVHCKVDGYAELPRAIAPVFD